MGWEISDDVRSVASPKGKETFVVISFGYIDGGIRGTFFTDCNTRLTESINDARVLARSKLNEDLDSLDRSSDGFADGCCKSSHAIPMRINKVTPKAKKKKRWTYRKSVPNVDLGWTAVLIVSLVVS